ncbi:MAG: DUF2267 domain-containing protein [Rhodobacteraceae bacterium]|nr:DUF2267 domain-containing protein [Paracoccaceae bacterium]
MPMPWTYRQASREWRAFLDDVRDVTGLETDNVAYTAIQGVLQAFRRRLTPAQGIAFAGVLPAVPRAIFVEGWDIDAAPRSFGIRADWIAEAKALRPAHNLTPDNAVEATARALWRQVNHRDLSRVLDRMPSGARDFWSVPGASDEELAARLV